MERIAPPLNSSALPSTATPWVERFTFSTV